VDATDPVTPPETTATDLSHNRALVTELFVRLGRGDVDGIGELLHESFVSHNPRIPHDPAATDGRQAFLGFLRGPDGQRLLAATVDTHRMAADGDLVWVHNHLGYPGSPGIAAVDILRIEDGLVAEHWDVVQPVPDDLPHPHGMF
jgi:predicted SnoaL-like aldol condensation-catalyzing enzyme